jgi:MarR family transcriptional regulator, temperature-dependent positive regulator of motility
MATTPPGEVLSRNRAANGGAGAAPLHPLISVKLWQNPCWFSFRINYLGLQFNVPVYGWIEQRYGLVRPEFVVIYSLGLSDGLAAKDVCASGGFPKNTLSRAIQKLLRRKLIRRAADPRDRRSYVLRLTAEGRRIFDETLLPMVEREQRMLSALTPQEQQTLSTLLARLVEDTPNWPNQLMGDDT